MGDQVILLDRVERTFRSGDSRIRAVHDLNLSIGARDAVAITGPSGSGKTTLLHLIGGLDRPDAGSITVLGERLEQLSESKLTAFRAANLGLVFQEPHLLPGLTALENVVVARLPFAKRHELEQAGRRLLEAVGLTHRADHPPSRLSAGERQRVGIARALAGKPKLLLADEPTGNLDASTTEEILSLLDRMRQQMGLTLVVVTHDPAVAAMADREVRLRDGTIIEDSSARRYPAIEPRSIS